MKKIFLLILIPAVLVACGHSRPEKFCDTYRELPDPNPAVGDWATTAPGLNAAFGNIDTRYAMHVLPEFKEKLKYWEGVAWKGERISAQLVLWTTEELKQVEIEATDLSAGGKAKIPASVVHPHFVRYTMTDEFAGGCGYRKPENFASSLSADVLDPIDCMDMEACSVRPVWITVDVPRDAASGIYKGHLLLYARSGGKTVEKKLDLQVEVLDRVLPPASEWPFHLDLWQHPTAVARWYNVPVWSDEHFELMRPLMKRLADAGQKVITATLNKDPWNGQCYDLYADMIAWTRKVDGSWAFDYSVFDRWAAFMMDLGINRQINCYSMIPWNNELHYLDEAKKDTVTVRAVPGTPSFEEFWIPFIKDFREHLKSKSWLEITNIAVDERDPQSVKAALSLLQKYAPEMGTALSDNHKSYKEYPFIKEISVAYGAVVEPADRAYRSEQGLNTIYYVCCSDRFPNAFSFSPPAESVYNIWYAVAAGFDGFSRWAYNSWVENPLLDTRFRTWPAGDTNYAYPDNRSSIRFERLLEGMQQVEKLRILKGEFNRGGDEVSKAKIAKLDEMLARFNVLPEPLESAEMLIDKANRLLNELSR